MKNQTLLSIAAMGLLFLSCRSAPTEATSKIRDTDENHVKDCKMLGTVIGGSTLSGDIGKRNAMTQALNRADKIGATDIVWINISGDFNTAASASARAYQCEEKH